MEELLDTIKGQHSEDVLHEQKMQSVQNTVDMLQKEVQMLESRLYVGRRSSSFFFLAVCLLFSTYFEF